MIRARSSLLRLACLLAATTLICAASWPPAKPARRPAAKPAATDAPAGVDQQVLAPFTYLQDTGGGISRVGGLYHQNADRVVICVQDPIRQWIRITPRDVTIYYPAEQRALRLGPASPFSNPFYLLFLGSRGSDLDLGRAGFRLSRKVVLGDTVRTHWSPPEGMASRLRDARLTVVNDHLVAFELTAADGSLLESVLFSNYTKVGTQEFPLRLEMTQPPPNPSREEIRLSGLQIGVAPADSIAQFAIPSGIRIEDLSK
jgi:hypothetical protein